jgi:UDP-N-acetylmuramoyl-tripeptide--D-alanyl-D-alanine ligase
MVAQVLRLKGPVLATTGNLNNELGLPLTLFELDQRHQFADQEMGASKAGDNRYLAEIAKPDVGVVTNVGPAHLQGFGDEEGVARAKGEMYASLPAEGFAIINADETWAEMWTGLSTAGRRLTFGRGADCDVHVTEGNGHHWIDTPRGRFPLRLHLPGEHNVMNALAATAIACALGIGRDQIRAGLEATLPVPGRLNVIHAPGGWIVIDDTYNANPASLYAALQVLAGQPGERWLVLGDMLELGPSSRKLHAEMGEAASALGVQRLFAIGEQTTATVDAFGTGATLFSDHDALVAALGARLHPGVACLVKGSRSMSMERVVQAIAGKPALREAG